MKKLYTLLFLVIMTLPALSQDLVHSRKTSFYTYVFQITNAEARSIYRKDLSAVKESFFHTVIDSFATSQPYLRQLPVGHYLMAHAEEDQLVYRLQSVSKLQVKLLNNNRDLVIHLHDSLGNAVSDAKVRLKKNSIPYDAKTQAYRLNKTYKHGLLAVEYQGFTSYHSVKAQYKAKRFSKIVRRVFFGIPLGYVTRPFYRIYSSIRYWSPQGWIYDVLHPVRFWEQKIAPKFNKPNQGFIVFNKPRYRAQDTVRFKAVVLKANGKPVRKSLKVYLQNYTTFSGKPIKLTRLIPYQKGLYEYSFVLHDSLKLKLGSQYSIDLQSNYNIFLSERFKYEDYELKANTFALRLTKKEYTQGEHVTAFVKGTDENDLDVMDARVQLKLYPQQTGAFDTTQIIVADTLWRYEQKMEATGETRIVVPDSVLHNANMSFVLEAVFLNANNERHIKTQGFERKYAPAQLVVQMANDSLVAEYQVAGQSQPHQAELVTSAYTSAGSVIGRHRVQLPYREPLNPYVQLYELKSGKDSTFLEAKTLSSNFQVATRRTADSVWVQMTNPRKLPFWYSIYYKNTLLKKGSGTQTLDFREKAHRTHNYSVSVQYIWNNEVHEEEYSIPLYTKQLNIETSAPETVSPGQTVPIQIHVRDYQGKPVSNVDLTAYGVTRKFTELHTPRIPEFSKRYANRKLINTFHFEKLSQTENKKKLQWQRWHQEMGLDSIAYFQFLYPKTGVYTHYLPMPNLMTQIAPFVVINGVIEPIYMLFIDTEPRYFQVTDVGQRYSFHVDSGYHSVQIRTRTLTIKLDSVYLKRHQKLILSIDPASFYQAKKTPVIARPASKELRQQTRIDTITSQLSANELATLNAYTMPVRWNFTRNDYIYVRQNKQLFLLNAPDVSSQPRIIGPVKPQPTQFVWKNSFSTDFTFESGFEYDFQPQLLKMRTWKGYDKMSLYGWQKIVPRFEEKAWTVYEIDSLTKARQNVVYVPAEYYNNPQVTHAGKGTLELRIANDTVRTRYYALYHNSKAGFLRITPAYGRTFYDLEAGSYCLVALMADSSYLTIENIVIQKNATTYRQLFWNSLQRKDAYSRQLMAKIKELLKVSSNLSDTSKVSSKPQSSARVLYPSSSPSGQFRYHVQGRVLDETGAPVPGVSVSIRGTTRGTTTNADGFYELYVDASSVLDFSFIGYITEEMAVNNRSVIDVQLTADIQALSEVVVTGYGVQRMSSITGYTSTVSTSLQGKAAGVTITQNGGQIRIRGVANVSASQRPLIVIDGVPYFDLADVDPAIIASAELLKDETAVALYGARAANGVILITSKPNSILPERKTPPPALAQAGSSIRSRFSDYAFWQPRLRTDKNGQATFNATFPDDITNWRTFVIGIGNRKQTGSTEAFIRAYKSVAATLAVPRFLVQGDSTQVIGKALNYTPDTLAMQTAFEMDGKIVSQREAKVVNASIDSLMVTAPTQDSLKIKYFLQQPNGYTDGEVRAIPVFPVGTIETKGQFWNLEKDTTVQLRFDPALGKAKIYARAQVLDILLEEIEHVHRYEYLCNEQASSKIKLYLADKRIRTQLAKPFTHEADIRKALRRLEETQQKEGTWGWWKEDQPVVWVTTHVIEALLQAQEAGYAVTPKTDLLTNYLVYQLASPKTSFDERVRMLKLLKKLNAPVDFQKHVTTLDTFFVPKKPVILKNKLGYTKVIEPVKPTLYQYLQRIELRQVLGFAISTDTIFKTRQQTMFGSSYWGRSAYHPYLNEVQTTLLVYRILKTQGGHEDELRRIRNYFFEKRETGYWRNTYESAQILETILPDVLGTETSIRKSELVIANGAATQTVKEFPFEMEAAATSILTVSKTGTLPVYITGYQQFHNSRPEKVEKEFVVSTVFKGFGSSDRLLKKGEKVTLQATVNVTKDADYVLVEIPIPAGCSYDDEKTQTYRWNETHREAFRHKTTIYCTKLNKGTYTFTVDLVARYTGTYTVNPARAELMYFSTFFGRNEVKKVVVK